MIRKKLLPVLQTLLNGIDVSDEVYGSIMRDYSPNCKCSAEVKTINYSELCKLSKDHTYNITIIQEEKILTDTSHFHSGCEHVAACYQIDPFSQAIVIAESICKFNFFRVFRYKPHFFDEIINVPNISCFKYLFGYFNVYKLNGTLVENWDELKSETEVIAISKQILECNDVEGHHEIHIILRWYKELF